MKFRFTFLIVSFISGLSAQAQFGPPDQLARIMDEAMKGSDLPAVVALAVNSKGETLKYEYGRAVWTETPKVTSRHIFRIYSMTKLFTSIAVMQFVEKGKIGLDDDLSMLLPDMARIPILDKGKLLQATNPITLRHLLTHTSGFGFAMSDAELAKFDRSHWPYKDLPRRFESGTQFLYGTSTDWVGKLVEKLSGMNLEKYFQMNITGPLGMNRTAYNIPDSLKKFIVSRGTRGDDGEQPLKENPNRIPTRTVVQFDGSSGLFSSPEDFAVLLRCLLNNGEWNGVRILKASTIVEMTKNQIGTISMDHTDRYFAKGICCNLNGIALSSSKWGLAWMIDNEDKSYGRKAGTVLWGGLLNTYFFIDYKSGIAVSIYTQHLPFNHPATMRLLERFSEFVYTGK